MDYLFVKGISRLFNLNVEGKRYNPLTERFETASEIRESLRSGKYEDTSSYFSLDIKDDLKNGTFLKPAAQRPFRTAWKIGRDYWFDRGKYNALSRDENVTYEWTAGRYLEHCMNFVVHNQISKSARGLVNGFDKVVDGAITAVTLGYLKSNVKPLGRSADLVGNVLTGAGYVARHEPKIRRSLNWPAFGLLGTVVGGTAFQIYMGLRLNEWSGQFGDAIQNYDGEAFWNLLIGDFSKGVTPDLLFMNFTALATVYIATAVWTNYLQDRLEMNWRVDLTEKLRNKWLNKDKKTYYRLQNIYGRTENPDQRIADDVQKYTTGVTQITLGLGRQVANLAAFSVVLWNLSSTMPIIIGGSSFVIPGFMMWAVIGYAVAGTLLTHQVGKPLMKIDYQRERKEADFRASLIRVKDNAESIALSDGEAPERKVLSKKFDAVAKNFWALIDRKKKLQWLTSYYEQAASVFPYVVAAPTYFHPDNVAMARQCIIDNAAQGGAAIQQCNIANDVFSLGELQRISQAFGQVQNSLSWIINAYPFLAAFKATNDRLGNFMEDIETSDAEVELIREGKAEGFRPYLAENPNQDDAGGKGQKVTKLAPKKP